MRGMGAWWRRWSLGVHATVSPVLRVLSLLDARVLESPWAVEPEIRAALPRNGGTARRSWRLRDLHLAGLLIFGLGDGLLQCRRARFHNAVDRHHWFTSS